MSRKIIIHIEDDKMLDAAAMDLVRRVISNGKVSGANINKKRVPHYCWATIFTDHAVEVIRKDHSLSPDSFRIVRLKK